MNETEERALLLQFAQMQIELKGLQLRIDALENGGHRVDEQPEAKVVPAQGSTPHRAKKKVPRGKPTQIELVDEGMVFESVTAAGKYAVSSGMTDSSPESASTHIRKKTRAGKPAYGRIWRYV